ncbi:MAG: hypothetical protein WCQ50_19900 [Spirochaetota bacterium]
MIGQALVRRALEIHQLYQLSYWDSQILAAAEDAGCDQVLSQGFQLRPVLRRIKVRHSFLGKAGQFGLGLKDIGCPHHPSMQHPQNMKKRGLNPQYVISPSAEGPSRKTLGLMYQFCPPGAWWARLCRVVSC